MARTELDDHLRTTAIKAGADAVDGARAVGVRMDGDRVAAAPVDAEQVLGLGRPGLDGEDLVAAAPPGVLDAYAVLVGPHVRRRHRCGL